MEQDEKRISRWLRALTIAKILFEDQGYHTRYLQGIEAYIRGCKLHCTEKAPHSQTPGPELKGNGTH